MKSEPREMRSRFSWKQEVDAQWCCRQAALQMSSTHGNKHVQRPHTQWEAAGCWTQLKIWRLEWALSPGKSNSHPCCNTTQKQNSKAINTISAPLLTNLPVCLLLILLCPSEKIYTAACANRYRTESPASLLGADVTTPVAITKAWCTTTLSQTAASGEKNRQK